MQSEQHGITLIDFLRDPGPKKDTEEPSSYNNSSHASNSTWYDD